MENIFGELKTKKFNNKETIIQQLGGILSPFISEGLASVTWIKIMAIFQSILKFYQLYDRH